jgi:hypothetical protein
MMIKSFQDFLKEHRDQYFTQEDTFKWAVEMCKDHYEQEAISVGEYFDSKMRRLAGISMEKAEDLQYLLKQFPKVGERIPPNFQEISDRTVALIEEMKGES